MALYPEKPIYDIPGYPTIEATELIGKLEQQGYARVETEEAADLILSPPY